MGGMFIFSSRQMKKQAAKQQEEGKIKEEPFNPYKEAKKTGKSVDLSLIHIFAFGADTLVAVFPGVSAIVDIAAVQETFVLAAVSYTHLDVYKRQILMRS